MKHMKKIEYAEAYPGGLECPMIALFDDRQISADEVRKHIRSGEYSPFVIVTTQTQFNNVFASLINKEE